MIYDKPKIIGYQKIYIIVIGSKVENICNYNQNNIINRKLLKLLELLKLLKLLPPSIFIEINQ